MRKIKTYRFHINTKIPFFEWPQIVQCFLQSQNLDSGRFLYCFEDMTWCRGTEEERAQQLEVRRAAGPCSRALRDCPAFGEIKLRQTEDCSTLQLSNIDTETPFREEDILPLMKKLHRYYGFTNCDLYYADVDFFGDKLPTVRDLRVAERACRMRELPFDPAVKLAEQPAGSMIRLHRDCLKTNCIELSIDLLHDGVEKDPAPYLKAMRDLLPGVRMQEFVELLPTPEERKAIQMQNLSERAEPLEKRCRTFFNENLYAFPRKNQRESSCSVPRAMKKLGKKHQFLYHYDQYESEHALSKREGDGHWIRLKALVDTRPMDLMEKRIPFRLEFHTLGYGCSLFSTELAPCGQEDLEAFLDHVLNLIEGAEAELLPALCAVFSPCPEWFEPLPLWKEPI